MRTEKDWQTFIRQDLQIKRNEYMYKWLIVAIISIFILAFAFRQCTDTEAHEGSSAVVENVIDINDTINIGNESEDSHIISTERLDLNNLEDLPYATADTSNVILEVPRIIDPVPNQILKREGYTLSYNRTTKCANWVAWKLTKDHTDGIWSRKGLKYIEDIEAEYPRQEVWDWKINPKRYDHGHMCPAGDNKWSQIAMEQSFLLTNMCPQNRHLNSGDWKELEEKCRDWANEYGEIYIVCGPIFYDGKKETIGGSKEIWVPDAFYKVILCMKGMPKAIGFIYSNAGKHHSMAYYIKTVDEVEAQIGIDFFHKLPDKIEDNIESKKDIHIWDIY